MRTLEIIWASLLVVACIACVVWQITIKAPIFPIAMFGIMAVGSAYLLIYILKEKK